MPDVGMGADRGGMGVVEGFVGVDVADASEDSLVEEGWLDAGAFGADFLANWLGVRSHGSGPKTSRRLPWWRRQISASWPECREIRGIMACEF